MARVHGGPDASGAARWDFSTNANACGPCPQVLDAVRAADATRYPDPASTRLRESLGALHGVAAERVVMAASASEFIFRMTAWAARQGGRSVSVPLHGYGDYAAAAAAQDLQVVRDQPAQLVWLCEPSSPLGEPLTPVQGDCLVVDRAYEPLRLAGTPTPLDPKAWQLWTPNKALGLCGVRGAYAIAPDAWAAAQLDACAPSWPLGAHGAAMLEAWCAPSVQDWLAGTRATLAQWKEQQQALCESLGWEVRPSCANFFVVRGLASGTLAALRGRGVQLRDCASFGLPGFARLSVQPPQAQQALRDNGVHPRAVLAN